MYQDPENPHAALLRQGAGTGEPFDPNEFFVSYSTPAEQASTLQLTGLIMPDIPDHALPPIPDPQPSYSCWDWLCCWQR